jgi:hypothetical protein
VKHARRLACGVCDLKLDAHEAEALGIDGMWVLDAPDVDLDAILEASEYANPDTQGCQ